ncbi:Integral membrane sensor signal transduction histidine kinase [Ruminococcaceae bacterium BL-4]|nr:Integral membrane sensor signal transduction histidine kinase [Ruminococcaceae bacterium BL-4]
MKLFLKRIGYWLILLLLTDLTFILMTWLLRPDAMKSICLFILLFTAIIIGVGYFLQCRTQKKEINAVESFLNDPNEATKQALIVTLDNSWAHVIETGYARLKKQNADLNEKQLNLQNYQEYIEAWTHEIKTPMSLMTLVLGNHKDEMSPYVYSRMEHSRRQISEDVEKILYYARLQTAHVDYNFTRFRLDECAEEVIREFISLIAEKQIDLVTKWNPTTVVSDRKVLAFMISQLLSNAVKYAAKKDGQVFVSTWQDDDDHKIHLCVRDNGAGVPLEDAPFIFEKGFTGNHPDRQKATGMGLYLVKKYAEALSAEVNLKNGFLMSGGFGIELIFPCVV